MWKKSVQFSVRTEFCKHMTVHTFVAASRHLYIPRLAVTGEGWWGQLTALVMSVRPYTPIAVLCLSDVCTGVMVC